MLEKEIQSVIHEINKMRHLIEMYKVMDDHTIMDLWRIEKACKFTDKDFVEWRSDFQKTKDGFILKT